MLLVTEIHNNCNLFSFNIVHNEPAKNVYPVIMISA